MKKKIFALALSMTMAFSAVGAYAEVWDVGTEDASGTITSNQVGKGDSLGVGSSDITGDGEVPGGLDKDITIVTLPSYAPGFVLDPTGMYATSKAMLEIDAMSAAEKTALVADTTDPRHELWDDTNSVFDQGKLDAYTAANAGKLTYKGDVMRVTNIGANPVAVSATFIAKSSKGKTEFVASTGSDIATTTDPKVSFQAVYNDAVKESAAGSVTTTEIVAPRLTLDPAKESDGTTLSDGEIKFTGVAGTNSADFLAGGTTIRLALKGDQSYGLAKNASTGKIEYVPGQKLPDGTAPSATLGFGATDKHIKHAQGFIIAGQCSKNANWDAYGAADPVDALSYRVVYKVDKLEKYDDPSGKVTVEGGTEEAFTAATGLIGTPSAVVLGFGASSAGTAGSDLVLTFNGGIDGITVAKTKFIVTKADGSTFNVMDQGSYWRDGSYGSLEDNKVTLKAAALTAAGVGTAGATFKVTVTGSDGKDYVANVTMS